MARRRRASRHDPFADLAQRAADLERELSVQREALDRLKQMAAKPSSTAKPAPPSSHTPRRSA